jgi:cobalt-zinc-cadmium resistance protein CzcA
MNIARGEWHARVLVGIFIADRDMGSVVADMKERVAKAVEAAARLQRYLSGEFRGTRNAQWRALPSSCPCPCC